MWFFMSSENIIYVFFNVTKITIYYVYMHSPHIIYECEEEKCM